MTRHENLSQERVLPGIKKQAIPVSRIPVSEQRTSATESSSVTGRSLHDRWVLQRRSVQVAVHLLSAEELT